MEDQRKTDPFSSTFPPSFGQPSVWPNPSFSSGFPSSFGPQPTWPNPSFGFGNFGHNLPPQFQQAFGTSIPQNTPNAAFGSPNGQWRPGNGSNQSSSSIVYEASKSHVKVTNGSISYSKSSASVSWRTTSSKDHKDHQHSGCEEVVEESEDVDDDMEDPSTMAVVKNLFRLTRKAGKELRKGMAITKSKS